MPCPFGFHAEAEDLSDIDEAAADKTGSKKKAGGEKEKKAGCPFAHGSTAQDDRFDYKKDPVAWFYQNQIKSEEEFQAKKEQLREEARARLDGIFEKKGKHLIVDSDDDDFSICSSELSAWDSDVHSINTLASCANSWAAGSNFTAPALTTLRILLICTMIAALHSGWQSLQAMLQINRFWGIIIFGWVPTASVGTALATAVAVGVLWYMTDTKSKAGLLGAQVVMQLLVACCSLLAMLCWVYPSRVDSEFKTSVCKPAGNTEATARLCQYLPMVQEQVSLTIASIMAANAYIAVLALGTTCCATWHQFELSFVEKKASKHKRRRRHRKNAIPWDKIKVEDIGPVSYCGGAPPPRARSAATAAKEGKKRV